MSWRYSTLKSPLDASTDISPLNVAMLAFQFGLRSAVFVDFTIGAGAILSSDLSHVTLQRAAIVLSHLHTPI